MGHHRCHRLPIFSCLIKLYFHYNAYYLIPTTTTVHKILIALIEFCIMSQLPRMSIYSIFLIQIWRPSGSRRNLEIVSMSLVSTDATISVSAGNYIPAAPILMPEGPWQQVINFFWAYSCLVVYLEYWHKMIAWYIPMYISHFADSWRSHSCKGIQCCRCLWWIEGPRRETRPCFSNL